MTRQNLRTQGKPPPNPKSLITFLHGGHVWLRRSWWTANRHWLIFRLLGYCNYNNSPLIVKRLKSILLCQVMCFLLKYLRNVLTVIYRTSWYLDTFHVERGTWKNLHMKWTNLKQVHPASTHRSDQYTILRNLFMVIPLLINQLYAGLDAKGEPMAPGQ